MDVGARSWRTGPLARGLGYVAVALGAIGVVLPVVPTVPFLLAGVWLLGPEHWAVRPWLRALGRLRGDGASRRTEAEGREYANRVGEGPREPGDARRHPGSSGVRDLRGARLAAEGSRGK